MKRNGKEAWVLAEWLTALALVAVIAMIALPNYFEAKTRGDVSQVVADLRRLETALVSYKLDTNKLIPDYVDYIIWIKPMIQVSGRNDPFIWGKLTTPIAYLGSLPIDGFVVATGQADPNNQGWNANFESAPYYRYYGPGWNRDVLETYGIGAALFLGEWLIGSPGPDKSWGIAEWERYIGERNAGFPRIYDPSNGIMSFGDIVRWTNMERTLVAPVE